MTRLQAETPLSELGAAMRSGMVKTFGRTLTIFTAITGLISLVTLAPAATPAQAVVYGKEVTRASVSQPWAVSIWYAADVDRYESPVPICSGSLIESDVVLTAAHCVMDEGFFFVKLGADTLRGPGALVEVSAAWRSPRYSEKRLVNDIGLLKLETPWYTEQPLLETAVLADLKQIASSKSFNIFGWGVDQNRRAATYLKTASLLNQGAYAKKNLTKIGYNATTMLAAGTYISKEKIYAGACNGDSGGPLVAKVSGQTKIVGITSWGVSGCDKKRPTIFTNVAYFERDLEAGKAVLGESVLTQNRAVPKVVDSPAIIGAAKVGSSLTCNSGKWSENTKLVETSWASPQRLLGVTAATVQITQADAGQTFVCNVTGYSDSAKRTLSRSLAIPVRPSSNSYLTISGVYAIYPAVKIGDVASCSGLAWNQAGVTESLSWYASDSSAFSTSNRLLGSGKTLYIDKSIGQAIAGKYLQCLATGTSDGGVMSYFSSIQVAAPSMPLFFSLTISGLTSGTVAPAIGTVASCDATVENSFSESYEWTITDNAYPPRVLYSLGNSRGLTVTQEILTKLNGNYLQCRVTAEGLGGVNTRTAYLWYLFSLPQVNR